MKNKLIIYLLLSLILIYTEKLCVQENLIKINPRNKMMINGIIDINGIEILPTDNLTDVLKKTKYLKKSIKNENNFQIVYIENVLICKTFTNISLVFSQIGKLHQALIGFSMNDEKSYLVEVFHNFFYENQIANTFIFEKGKGELIYEPHFKEYNIKITYT